MANVEVRDGYTYTKDHEWVREEGAERLVGITAFAVDQLGDITLVNLEVKPGDTVTAGKSFGTVESVKTLSDLFAPVSGKVVRVNGELESKPELVNEDCYGKAWMIAIEPSGESGELLDAAAYRTFLETSAHLPGALTRASIPIGHERPRARGRRRFVVRGYAFGFARTYANVPGLRPFTLARRVRASLTWRSRACRVSRVALLRRVAPGRSPHGARQGSPLSPTGVPRRASIPPSRRESLVECSRERRGIHDVSPYTVAPERNP